MTSTMSSVITLFLRLFHRIVNCLWVLRKSLLNLSFKPSSLSKKRCYCCFWTNLQSQTVTFSFSAANIMRVQSYDHNKHASSRGYVTRSVIIKCRVCRVCCNFCYQIISIFFYVAFKC